LNTKMRGQRIGEVPEIEGSLPCLLFGKGTCIGCYSEAVHRIRKAKVVPGAARANGKGLLRAGVWREWTPEDWERFKKLFPERRYFLVTRGIWPEEFYGRVLADPLLVNLQVSAWYVDGELSPDVEKLKRLLSASDKTIVRVITSGENAATFSRLIEELGCWWRFMETPWRKPGGPKTYGTETPLDALGTRVGIRCNTPCETCVKENGFLGCAATAPFLRLLPTFPEFQPARHERRERKRMLWKRLVLMGLNNLGGEAELKDLYAEVLAIEPAVSESPLWKTRVRAKVQELCVRSGKGRWNLVPKETAPSEEVLVRVKGGGVEACPS